MVGIWLSLLLGCANYKSHVAVVKARTVPMIVEVAMARCSHVLVCSKYINSIVNQRVCLNISSDPNVRFGETSGKFSLVF